MQVFLAELDKDTFCMFSSKILMVIRPCIKLVYLKGLFLPQDEVCEYQAIFQIVFMETFSFQNIWVQSSYLLKITSGYWIKLNGNQILLFWNKDCPHMETYFMHMQIVIWCLFGTKCLCKPSAHVKTVKEDKIMLPAIKKSMGILTNYFDTSLKI